MQKYNPPQRIRRAGYMVKQSFSNDFVRLLEDLYEEYGEQIFDIQGIANKYTDIAEFSRNFFNKSNNVANVSIDANANVKEKNVAQYTIETNKALMKINSFYTMFKYIRDMFSYNDACAAIRGIINGNLFLNDAVSYGFTSYCYAFDLRQLLMNGMNFVDSLNIKPPKRSESFIALIIQSTAFISNQIAGAASFPDFFIILDYFYRKEMGEDYINTMTEEQYTKICNQFQNLIYSLNFCFRSGGQSAFTNLSVMDKGFLNNLFKDYFFPDRDVSRPNIDSTFELSKKFFEYFSSISAKEGVFTFPVMTLAISVDEDNNYIDPDFVDWSAKANSEKALGNIFINKPTSFSSCCRLSSDYTKLADTGVQNSFGVGGLSIGCYDNKTEIMTENGFMKFSKLMEEKNKGNKIRVLSLNTDTNETYFTEPTEYFDDYYEGNLHHYKNSKMDICVTPNHNMFVETRKNIENGINGKYKIVKSEDITNNHNLPRIINELKYKSDNHSQDNIFGIAKDLFCEFLGFYLGDGTLGGRTPEVLKKRGWEISFTFKKERKKEYLRTILKRMKIKFKEYEKKTRKDTTVFFIYNKELSLFLLNCGKTLEKHIPQEFLNSCSHNQLVSLITGLVESDGHYGGNNGRWFYTSSNPLYKNFIDICSRIGIQTSTFSRKRKSSVIGGRTIIPKNVGYEIKLLEHEKYFTRIKKHRKTKKYSGNIYCVEVPHHTLFVRRNGKTTWCGNSHRVCGINLPRLAIDEMKESKKKKPKDILSERLEICHKILLAHREILRDRIESGFLPLYTHKWIDLNKQYSTIGLIGVYEYIKNKRMEITSTKGVKETKQLLKKIESTCENWQVAENAEGHKNIYNIEQIPAETMAVRLAEIDSILGYNKEGIELYSNQYIPLVNDSSVYDRFRVQGEFDSHTSGGSILHLNVNDSDRLSEIQFRKLIEQARISKTAYFAVNYCFSVCDKNHTLVGNHDVCSICGSEDITKYTRVCGFITPITSWSSVRKEYEFENRVFYTNKETEE